MQALNGDTKFSNATLERAKTLFQESLSEVHKRTDRLFARVMIAQWLAGIAIAFWLSPRTWIGASNQWHLHVWASIFIGGLLAGFPVWLAWKQPGHESTRAT